MPILALVLILAAVIGGIVYFRDPGTTNPTPTPVTTEVPNPTTTEVPTPSTVVIPTANDVPTTAPATDTTPAVATPNSPSPSEPTVPPATTETAAPEKKTLAATIDYRTPSREAVSISVSLELVNDVVTSVASTYTGGSTDRGYQDRFDSVYTTQVIGKKLSEISLSRVGGASLTSQAFNKAIDQMEAGA